MTAPGTTSGELREAIAQIVLYAMQRSRTLRPSKEGAYDVADALFTLPELRDLLAERDTLAAQVRAVEGLAEEYDAIWQEKASDPVDVMIGATFHACASDLRRALGTPTTGGGE